MIKLIAALSKNQKIGQNNQMPWHIPEDLEYFKRVTNGHPILMGRKTFESIGRPLPNRRNIILTQNKAYKVEGVEVIHSFKEALFLCQNLNEVFIIGGGEIYLDGELIRKDGKFVPDDLLCLNPENLK